MSILYDSTNPFQIPSTASIVAGYINGIYTWPSTAWTRFPNATKLTISVLATEYADILDVENGNANPLTVPSWLSNINPTGTIYCSRLTAWPKVITAVMFAHLPQPTYWIADQTTVEHLVPGSVATQWKNNNTLYDISVTNGIWPARPIIKETTMELAVNNNIVYISGERTGPTAGNPPHTLLFVRHPTGRVEAIDLSLAAPGYTLS